MLKKNNPGCNCCEPESSSSSSSQSQEESSSSSSNSSSSSFSSSSSTNDACQACSHEHNWLVDISDWTGLADEIALGECPECPDLPGIYELTPTSFGLACFWEYDEEFCIGNSPTCQTVRLRITLQCTSSCAPTMTITLSDFDAGVACRHSNVIIYQGSAGDMDLSGSGVAVVPKLFAFDTFKPSGGETKICTEITPPETVTITRV